MPYDPPTMNAKNGTAFVRKWCPRRARLMTPASPRARRIARRREGSSSPVRQQNDDVRDETAHRVRSNPSRTNYRFISMDNYR